MPKMKGRPRAAAPKTSRRELLLDAAGSLMRERDTLDCPLSDIAARCGLNVALVSYYFGGKDGLLLALAKRDAAAALGELERLLRLPITPAEKLRRHIAGIIATFFRFPYLNPLLRELMRDASSKTAREITEYFGRPIANAMAALLEEGEAAGQIRHVDPMIFFLAVTGACEQIQRARAVLRVVFNTRVVNDALCKRYIDGVTDLFMNGYLKTRAEA
jgi:TetR/AcrR family transcriptional regulator